MVSGNKRSRKQAPAVLQYADSERNADQYYFGGLLVPDPFISIGFEGEKIAFLSRLEIGRAGRESTFDTLLSLEEWNERAAGEFPGRKTGPVGVILLFCRERKIRRVRVGPDFPVGLGFALRESGLEIEVASGMLFPDRVSKTDEEAKAIAQGNRCSAAGIRAAERILKESIISGNALLHEGRRLTSERLQFEIEKTCLEMRAVSMNTIVAGGVQACDPHCKGSGLLRPHQFIIMDVFPRVMKTGYHGDLTRTFLKGHASDAQRDLIGAVRTAHETALERIKTGVRGHTVHGEVERVFAQRGYRTENRITGPVGYIHGTGHGLGLDIHEPPRISRGGPRLKTNMVVSVEPGLYYPEIGGCRIEDIVRVKPSGIEMLSKLHYRWLIR
ncbi:MAG: aminopeptidase P family protein [Verrucomicrobia bacterium]|nr:MAG: aminopeptidase P family protein [Verrucomicrobiota bacterium]